ncbi:MAG: hypothetical protein CM1200mP41_23940 [Gammaproteobacteria bacterium]|nr:MAG: hypothetical protein CM1200mP41_23940 [Gammaproteobacteria bacterium]
MTTVLPSLMRMIGCSVLACSCQTSSTLTFGLDPPADVMADVSVDGEALELLIRLPNDSIKVNSIFWVVTTRQCPCSGHGCLVDGLYIGANRCGLGNVQPIKGRLEPRRGAADSSLIDDPYNANPASLDVASNALPQGRENGSLCWVIWLN